MMVEILNSKASKMEKYIWNYVAPVELVIPARLRWETASRPCWNTTWDLSIRPKTQRANVSLIDRRSQRCCPNSWYRRGDFKKRIWKIREKDWRLRLTWPYEVTQMLCKMIFTSRLNDYIKLRGILEFIL